MVTVWLFPSGQNDSQVHSSMQIEDALQALLVVEDVDALEAALEQWSEIVSSRYTLATLYVTAVRNSLDGEEETAQELSELLHVLGSVHCHGVARTCQRLAGLAESPEQEQVILLSPADLVELFTLIRETLTRDEYPDIQVTLLLEIGDQRALVFDETQEQQWLEQAAENYTAALALETQEKNPIRWAYLHMRRGIVGLYRQGDGRADFVEQAIVDLEAALDSDLLEADPPLRASINQHLGQAYSERIYGQRLNNLRRAVAAYRAALNDLAGETALHERIDILSTLANLYVDLHEEQPAREAFAELRLAVQDLERLGREQLENGEQPPLADRPEQPDSVVVAAVIEEWLTLTNHKQLFAFLDQQQDILVSDAAIARLQRLLTTEETNAQGGRAEHITSLLQLLENAQTFSVDVAWQRYLMEVFPALEAARLLALAETMPEYRRRFLKQWDLFCSPAMLATLYLLSLASQNEMEEQQTRQLISFLKKTRALPPALVSEELERILQNEFSSPGKDEEGPFLTPKDVERVMSSHTSFQFLMTQEIMLLPEQVRAEFLPAFMQMAQSIGSSRLTETAMDISKVAERVLPSLDRQQTPHLWANFHWICAVSALADQQGDQAQAFAHCEAALSVITQELASALWAMLVLARAAIHMQMVQNDMNAHLREDERQEHSRQALQDLSLAEAHFSPEENPFEWAMTRGTRGMALVEEARHRGLTRERFTQIIADFDASIPIMMRKNSLWSRILLHFGRASIRMQYRQGDRQAAIARVLEDCNMVITLAQPRSSQMMAEVWADALILRGLACIERINAAPSENAAQALNDFKQALSVYTRETHPQDWASALVNRGSVYMQMGTGNSRENQEKALQDFSNAIDVLKNGSNQKILGQALLNRSTCLMQRIADEKTQNQRKALEDCNAALKIFQEDGYRYEEGRSLVNRAGLFMQLLAGDRRANFHHAEADCSAALQIFTATETPQEWAEALVNRGMVRRSLGLSLGMNQRGVGMRTMAQRLFSQDPTFIFNVLEESQSWYERALSDFSDALTILTRSSHPQEWAKVSRERGLTYAFQVQGYVRGDVEDNIRRGILDFDHALTVFSRHETLYEWAVTIANRAILYGELASKERPDDVAHALDDTDKALKVLTRQAAPANYCRLHFMRADMFTRLEQWSQVHEALLNVRVAQRDLVARAPGSQEQTDIVAEFALGDIYARDAWALFQIEPVDADALAIALEEGRALAARMAYDLDATRLDLLASEARERMMDFLVARNRWWKLQHQALFQPASSQQQDLYAAYNVYLRARKRIREQDNPDFMTPAPTMQQIGRALNAPDEALLYLVAGSLTSSIGGMALIVTLDAEGNPRPMPVSLPGLHELAVFDLLEVAEGAAPQVRIEEALTNLGGCGLNEVVQELQRQRITKVRLIPYSWLGLFPWPALLVTNASGQRRHLSELFAEVTIAPSARSLEMARQHLQAQDRQRRALLIASNPHSPELQKDLPFALAEAGALRRIAQEHGYAEEQICYLPPADTTRRRLIEELPRARYAHLALHAEYCAGDPRRSRLILANPDGANKQEGHILLGEVLDGAVNLRGMRLLTLSACETSVIDVQRVPNEALGLAAGFLQAGASAVIASLWSVEDAPTFLLMARFAQFYLDLQGLWSPAAALAAAQRWLRAEATNQVLATYDPALVEPFSSRMRSLGYRDARQEIRRQAAQQLREGNADVLPYAHPFFWAGFVVMGQ